MKIYRKITKPGKITEKYFGLNLVVQTKLKEGTETRYFFVYKTIETDKEIKRRIFGIPFFSSKKDPLLIKVDAMTKKIDALQADVKELRIKHQMGIAIARQHSRVFPKYKNKHEGKDFVILATGPTLCRYKKIEDAIHIGVNKSFLFFPDLDYWFAIDNSVTNEYHLELQQTHFTKFFGVCSSSNRDHLYLSRNQGKLWNYSDRLISKFENAEKFYFDHPSESINRDIESQALPDLGSCVFSAVYFALYAGARRIYLVGCDCAANGYFDKTAQSDRFNSDLLIKGWKNIQYFIECFYPDVEIISVNPVGLKGIFPEIIME